MMSEYLQTPHSVDSSAAMERLGSSLSGLNPSEAKRRLEVYGLNHFPDRPPESVIKIFLHQFLNPLIYVLLAAAGISVFFGDYIDAVFIAAVLLVNAFIGTIQEYSAERGARALKKLVTSKSVVERGGEIEEVESSQLVPGDILHLEPGNRISADIRLIHANNLEVDESLLTGESLAVSKNHKLIFNPETTIGDRRNMGFTGSMVTKGRAKGVVVATGLKTELGKIADSLSNAHSARPPLLIRMETLTKNIAFSLLFVTLIMGTVLLTRGESWHYVMLFSVALAVSAIPEGLPVAITVALAVASRRMAKRNVIIRKLPAVEALGSCTFVATDKTGTLTVNQLTVREISLPALPHLKTSGTGLNPNGSIEAASATEQVEPKFLEPILTCGLLCNEAQLWERDGVWKARGDAVDLAFLVLAHKAEKDIVSLCQSAKAIDAIPFESENQYAAVMHEHQNQNLISVKGAFEKVLPLCTKMLTPEGEVAIDSSALITKAESMAESGLRVLALAKKTVSIGQPIQAEISDLTFLGVVGMLDPLRPEAAAAISSCHKAGIDVAMVTGDHPKTALAIARELGLAKDMDGVVTGMQLRKAKSKLETSNLIKKARVFARMEPEQKLKLVQELLNEGYFVAVTGDGANDAPALKAANVGVAMGKTGTEAAWETADIILTDDRFASIVSGVEEGRVAYSNIRKVVYLAISTGIAEILLFSLSLAFNTPMPLTPAQILWLNLVTNGIQHVALAFEPGEGDELNRPPRRPQEPVFDRLMIERMVLSAAVIGGVSFWYFDRLIDSGTSVESARNLTLLLMVLFENIMVANCRSELRSAFTHNPLRNPILLFGTLGAQALHIISLYLPWISDVLHLEPVSLGNWTQLLMMSLSVLVVMELHKLYRRWRIRQGAKNVPVNYFSS